MLRTARQHSPPSPSYSPVDRYVECTCTSVKRDTFITNTRSHDEEEDEEGQVEMEEEDEREEEEEVTARKRKRVQAMSDDSTDAEQEPKGRAFR